MSWQAAPSGYPSGGDYLTGDVKNASGSVVGRIAMGWVSKYLRKATVEIDRVSQAEAPLDSGGGENWKSVGDDVGWDINIVHSNQNIAEPSGEFWSDAECHAAMLAQRDASNLDAEWRYHVLCVRRLDSTERGIMYDAYGGDSNNVPREGCAISSHWTIPSTPEWGTVQNVRFGAARSAYFRTAVHETGHAFGLYHNTADNGFMNTTNVIAANSQTPGSPTFPNNIQWSFDPEDAKRLRHMPDIYVRPGGTPFGTAYAATPISPTDLRAEVPGLQLRVSPVLESVPIGAPVRVEIELVNTGNEAVPVPASLNMKTGFVKGTVIDAGGTARSFSPLLRCVEDHPMMVLAPGESVLHALTLLRGVQGALFPMPGVHRVIVEVNWDSGGMEAVVAGEASVMVNSATDAAHSAAALRVLSTPDTLLTLVLGGDHLDDGIQAIRAALDNPVLRPHFSYIEAKRLCERFGQRKPNREAAAELIDESTVMSPVEVKKAAAMFKLDGNADDTSKKVAQKLKSKERSAGAKRNGGSATTSH
jgi:predicted Zn-dependent protease